jgi:glycosyltransferase involved in cell wall biosynthesis
MIRNVIHVITTLERGGAENQLVLLAKEQVKRGFEVTIVPLKGIPELQGVLEGYGVYVDLTLINRNPMFQCLKLRKKLNIGGQIVHAHLPRSELLAAISRGKSSLIFTRHNCEKFLPNSNGIIARILSRFVQSRSRAGIMISHTVLDFMVTNKEIKNKKNISIIPYGFDPTIQYSSTDEEIPRKAEEFTVGTIARLTAQKDLSTLLKAFAEFHSLESNSKLIIIGTGPLEKELKMQANHLGIESSTCFYGRTSRPMDMMALMDVFVMTSLYEGFGLVLLEAFSSSAPVVASNNPTFSEILGAESPQLFAVSNSNALAGKLIEALPEKTRSDWTNNGTIIVNRYSPEKMVRRIEETYELARIRP